MLQAVERPFPRLPLALALLFVLAGPARAQTSNLTAFQNLALQCLAEAPDTARAFRLDAPAQMPYLRTALTEAWRQDGRAVFLADSSYQRPARPLPLLQYQIEAVDVAYARAGRRRVDRALSLGLRYSFTAPDGRLLDERACRDTFTDTIRRRNLAAVEDEAFPETRGEAPASGWFRRYLEPAVAVAATAVTVFLFFSLRSDRADSGS
jgi:hypothetical protein